MGKLLDNVNAVIEGTYHDDGRSYFKVADLFVHGNVEVVSDMFHRYTIHGLREENGRIELDVGRTVGNSVVLSEGGLSFCPGVVLPYSGGISNMLQTPRALFMEDRRIFVREDFSVDEDYILKLPAIIERVDEIFRTKSQIIRNTNAVYGEHRKRRRQ